jgi:membrane protease subunit HflK
MEFYRPRAGKEERPVFESRVLSLFTEPGGIMKNISETLDYQFGFSISGTWLYRIFENSIVPLLLLWMISLWLMTSITEILPDELGLRESFGVVEQNNLLEAGIHFNLPWPYGKILRVPARDIQEVFIGTGEKEGKEKYEPIILWAISHYEKEENFLVAAEKAVSPEELPVSYVSAIFNVQYKIKKTEIFDYAYRNQDIKKTIKMVGECVAVKYLAGKDILKILAVERKSGEEELKMKMQEAYDNAGLGIEILFLNILDVHPPVEKVAPVFQNVVGALEEKETEILVAKAYEKKIIPFAEAEKAKTILDAETESKNIVKLAEAENERFGKQLTAYRQMPSMFKLRTYLDFFENDCAQIKKIIIASEIPYNVFILNLEEKQRLDLLDIPIENITPEKNSN